MAVFFNQTSPFFYLLGPSLFFYVRGTLSDQHRLSLKDSWHFIPFFIQLIAIMPYIFKPWSYKLWVAGEVIRDVHNMLRIPDLVLLPIQLNMAMPLSHGYCIAATVSIWYLVSGGLTR